MSAREPRDRTVKTEAPVHDLDQVAVALHYDQSTDEAPRVVASGRGALAERILELAFASGVKVREDADLAEILAAVDVDTEIPIEAFAAVAEILAYVYRANGVPPEPAPEERAQP
jgi:flagellar biosynthesis protein